MRTLIYQVFVDRFAGPGGGALSLPVEAFDPWRHHAGGTLDGILARLDHIVALGADALYLTPIFRAETNHKYDTLSFDEIDAAFGGEGSFAALAAECQARGLGLFLDLVFNHVGERHPWFVEARADAAGAKRGFFKFERHPDVYSRWRGFGFLPELDLSNPAVLDALILGDSSVLRRCLRLGATGVRLDCANDLGRSVCALATRVAREERARDGVIGEVMAYAEAWVEEGGLDGVMNYWFREAVIGMAAGVVPAVQAAHNLALAAARYRPEALRRSWNVLSTHDTPRLTSTVPDPAARRLAMTLAFVTVGVPLLYYGEEVGMLGGADPENRGPMAWDVSRWDLAMLEHVKLLAALRRQHRALVVGEHLAMPQPGAPELLVFARVTDSPEDLVLVVANGSSRAISARVFTPCSFLFDHLPMRDVLGRSADREVAAGRIDVELEPFQVALLVPDDTRIPGYRFFRRG